MTMSPTVPLEEQTLGDLVAGDGRAAVVLERFGLDFCCGGKRTLETAARARGVSIDAVVSALGALGPDRDRDADPWPDLADLVRHVVDHHHSYVRQSSLTISAWLDRLVDRHGERHPELGSVREAFSALRDELGTHMMKEEHLLFPAICELAAARRTGMAPPPGPFGTLANPIRVMETEHGSAGALTERIRALTNGFTPPPDGCTTYRLCYAELARFDHDLRRHVHLENHVLFPRAIDLEQSLA